MDFDKVMQLLKSLHEHEVDYVLVGGMALVLHGLVRATNDVDLFVRPETRNVERFRSALRDLWDDDAIAEITAEDLAGDFPAVRYVPPDEKVPMDILARLGEAFRFEDIESQVLEYRGIPVRIATPRMLYRMKRDTVRSQDRTDAGVLREHFGLEED